MTLAEAPLAPGGIRVCAAALAAQRFLYVGHLFLEDALLAASFLTPRPDLSWVGQQPTECHASVPTTYGRVQSSHLSAPAPCAGGGLLARTYRAFWRYPSRGCWPVPVCFHSVKWHRLWPSPRSGIYVSLDAPLFPSVGRGGNFGPWLHLPPLGSFETDIAQA